MNTQEFSPVLDEAFPIIRTDALNIHMNFDGTHVAVWNAGAGFRGWVALSPELAEEVADFRLTLLLAGVTGQEWREEAAEAMQEALIENIKEYV